MRITPAILLSAVVACGSPSKSLEPTEPARSVGTTSSSDDGAAPAADEATASGGDAGDAGELRFAEVMARFERFVVALEPADGDCGALAQRIRTFAASEDAEVIRAMSRDKEVEAIIAAHRTELETTYAPLKERFVAVMKSCETDEDVQKAFARSRMGVKKREIRNPDGTVTTETVDESELESSED